MINAPEESIEKPEPFELNSFEFFNQALSFIEGEAKGTLGTNKPSPASPVKSENSKLEINSIKSEILRESRQYSWDQLLESTCTREKSPDTSLEETLNDDLITNLTFNSIDLDHDIVGTNSRLTDEYQMSDPNLRWIKTIIKDRDMNKNKIKINKKELENNMQKKLLK